MSRLSLGVEIKDYDLDRVGFSLKVLDDKSKKVSDAYLRMTLVELDAFMKALKAANSEIVMTAPEPTAPRANGNGQAQNGREGEGSSKFPYRPQKSDSAAEPAATF